MVFSSTVFLVAFLPPLLLAYFLCPRGLRNGLLIVASLLFYAWGERQYVALLAATAVVNWAAGLWIARSPDRRWRVVAAVTVNLLILAVFKYANFLIATINNVAGLDLAPLAVHLPAGVSFFAFQAISYVVDVARSDVPAERSLMRYSVYATLFPHLVAGPIVRYRDLSEQLSDRRITFDSFAEGVQRFVVGLGKKVLLADTLRRVADDVFVLSTVDRSTSAAWIGLLAFSLQIYFDFSGYSDMAIGLGRMFGFRFAENFCYPYAATSLREFWRRWHMTLSSWLRDYVYIPLGGSRRYATRNLLVTFAVCGLWHGAAWTFAVWGVWHGLALALERLTGRPLGRIGTTFVVGAGWVVFRAASLPHAGTYFAALGGFGSGAVSGVNYLTRDVLAALLIGLAACLPLGPWLHERLAQAGRRSNLRAGGLAAAEFVAALLILAVSCLTLAGGAYQPFLYFRF
jgi:alginate O-acetyltransferase complex protein AlgI